MQMYIRYDNEKCNSNYYVLNLAESSILMSRYAWRYKNASEYDKSMNYTEAEMFSFEFTHIVLPDISEHCLSQFIDLISFYSPKFTTKNYH